MTLKLPFLYVSWLEEYCQISQNKNKSLDLWHRTSILVCSPLVQFSKFNDFLLICWFLCINLSNFVSLVLKLHNQECHTQLIWFFLFNWLRNQNLHLISFSECAVTMIQPLGVITSPGFPQPYRNGIDCTWNIQLQIGQLIQFNFLHFDVEDQSNIWGWDTFASYIFPANLIVGFYHYNKILLISGMIHWKFMMEIQIHHPCWEIILGIPCRLATHLQTTNSSFIFILIINILELDSNWNTLQQVRIHTQSRFLLTLCLCQKKDLKIGIFII